MLKAVIFDMDGVIIDSEPIYYTHSSLKLKSSNNQKAFFRIDSI